MQTGADVSTYRHVSNFEAYKNSGRSFLLFKATDFKNGALYVDPTFERNRVGCHEWGLVPGAYLFLRSRLSPEEQALHYLRTIGDHRGLILAVDFEHAGATAADPESNPTPQQLSRCVQTIHDATGRWPWVYTNRGYWTSVGNPPHPGESPLWHSEWRPAIGAMYGGWAWPVCWQKTSTAVVPGIALPCDDNIFFGNAAELEAHAWGDALDCGSDMANAQERGWGTPDNIYKNRAALLETITVTGVRFAVHAATARLFEAFLTEITSRGYDINNVADDWSYAYRPIRGYTFEEARADPDKWSNHAWGLAIDVNATKNPMSSTLITDMPPWIDEVAAKYGLRWGGNYSGRKDAMHFEFMGSPADAQRIANGLEDVVTQDQMDQIFNRIEEAERRMARYVDHGNVDEKGTSNHHVRIREDIAAAMAEAVAAKAAVGQVLVEMSAIKALVQQMGAASGADPTALADAVVDRFATRLEG